jgi:integrase
VSRSKAMAGRVFQRSGRPGFYVRVRSGMKEVTRYAGATRKTAHEFAARLLLDRDRRELLDKVAIPSVAFAEIEAQFLAHLEARHAPTTVAVERIRLKAIVSHFSSHSLCDVGPAQVGDFVTALRTQRGQSAASCNRMLALLSVLFGYAIERGLAATNPVKGLSRPKEDRPAVPYLDDKDISRFETAAGSDHELRALIRLLADAGLRRGEALALTWMDVDLSRGSLVVRRSKTHEAREVPLTENTRNALSDQASRCPSIALHKPTPVFPGLVAVKPSSVTGRFKTVARRAGSPDLRLHDLRHAFCSRLAQRGVPLTTIAKLAGHRSVQTTQRYAEHMPKGATRLAIEALEGSIAAPRGRIQGGPEGGPSDIEARKRPA